ncbi:hypothetical protein EZV77_08590 [Burkholderia thailandensis]|nr:hypothetical protein A8H32_32315 [Burkholderia thailandensis]MDD1482559.1 transposase [Burkholderia thailandensis]MDD1486711.1 transposase [Burkholderia thailandensis]MDD1492893.1 transposase [Burkholderia thailandensis]PJO69259.1 hypothetical protein CWD92_27860 [Burkholderia thailandensis]
MPAQRRALQLGKHDDCKVAARLPVGYRLHLPREWSDDSARRQKAGAPEEIERATKPQIAPMPLREARQSGAPDGVVLADAGSERTRRFAERSASSVCSMRSIFNRSSAQERRTRLRCRPRPPLASLAGLAAHRAARSDMSR